MDLCQFVAIYFQLWMVEKLKEWYPSVDHTDLLRVFMVVVGTALEAGVIQEAENAPKEGSDHS